MTLRSRMRSRRVMGRDVAAPHLLTIDLELTGYDDAALHDQFARNGNELLRFLEREGEKATFFCVGDVLEQFPSLVQAIRLAGHEIACHGWRHTPLEHLSPAELEQGLDRFVATAERLGLGPIRGFRAPFFSLTRGTRWALDVLARAGFVYDSSILPAATLLYGDPTSSALPHRLDNGLVEMPITVWQPLRRWGVSVGIPPFGGTYLRLLPGPLLERLAARDVAFPHGDPAPLMSYLHPYDADPTLRRVRGFAGKPLHNFLLGRGRSTTMSKIRVIANGRESETVHGWIEKNMRYLD